METSFGSVFVKRYIQVGLGPVLNYSYFIPTFHHQIPTFFLLFLETIPTFFLLFHQRPLSSLFKVFTAMSGARIFRYFREGKKCNRNDESLMTAQNALNSVKSIQCLF